MNSCNGVAKFEPELPFEKTINGIKANHLISIASAAMNLSAINLFENKYEDHN